MNAADIDGPLPRNLAWIQTAPQYLTEGTDACEGGYCDEFA